MISREKLSKIDLSGLKRVHMIGILSPFASFCAKVLLDKGVNVTASEYVVDNPKREYWESIGVLYRGSHDRKYVTKSIDLVIFPNGPIPGNPECDETEKLGILAITVGQMVGLLSKQFKTIAVAGTHGKTTTTALIVWMLKEAFGLPNFVVGDADDYITGMQKNWYVGSESDYLVVEACEYKKQFLDRAPSPFISVITHIDMDHTDYYKTQENYNSAFVEFLLNTRNRIVIDLKGVNEKIVAGKLLNKRNDLKLYDVSKYRAKGCKIESALFGDHNQENLLRALVVGDILGISYDKVLQSLLKFPGVSSRFEYVGDTLNGAHVYKDFAHNPSKIMACLQGAKEQYPNSKIVLVFQPHSYERTYTFRNEFVTAINKADVVIIPNIFSPKRERDIHRKLISAKGFVRLLQNGNSGLEVLYTGNLRDTVLKINDMECGKNTVIILASAGDLGKIVPEIVSGVK